MFTSILYTAVLATSTALLSQAMVTPNAPGPGDSFNEGASCHIGWAGDTDSPSAWLGMAIELMTGDNEAMVHLTTVATGQDGTQAGVFDYPCPAVTPNSAIYFYQFSAPATKNFTWTTRFTIAAANGSSTPATLSEKGSDGQTVLWGTGALVNPADAIPAPNFDSTSASGSNSVSGASPSDVLTSGASASAPIAPSPSAVATTPAASSSSPPQPSGTSAAVRIAAIDMRVWPIVAALTASAILL
ncbi:hypothetical protein GGX14DRAFT_530022 [Mycena pura]|uniref:Yeast cell wall synthesis Kre9/Knh1-like N-terminal domain-containing protein n=1 Tax=Mycena pura TaxID=153505 RepID=A0AAD6YVK8_9AGAR|nr:hypothetical protein GGX14DRAFT_530022 [Mycena pura]